MPTQSKQHMSQKHLTISKANTTMVVAISVAVFVVIFSLFAAKSLFSQGQYQQKVISEKKDALRVARSNTAAVEDLKLVYDSFATENPNVLGGSSTGDGPLDGSNPKLVLDSLPSVYDYPALSSSMEKILIEGSYQIDSIGGSEDAALAASNGELINDSTPVEIPYPVTVRSSVEGTKALLEVFERSIRPFYVSNLKLSGSGQDINAEISLKTYYQPATGVSVTNKVVR